MLLKSYIKGYELRSCQRFKQSGFKALVSYMRTGQNVRVNATAKQDEQLTAKNIWIARDFFSGTQ